MQVGAGDFPVSFFAFPLNVLLAALWLAVVLFLHVEKRASALVRFLSSGQLTFFSLLAFVGGCLVIGLVPQLPVSDEAGDEELAGRLGLFRFTMSWPFVAILFLLFTHLTFVTLRGWRSRPVRFRLIHGGLWLVLFCSFFGGSDLQTLHLVAFRDEPTRQAYSDDRRVHYTDYDVCLQDFRVDVYPNGMPKRFQAVLQIDNEPVTLEVNRPYTPRFGEDVYLSSYDVPQGSDTSYCVLQIVRQPWKYGVLAGIVLLLAGSLLLFLQGPIRPKTNPLHPKTKKL